jgi:LDH2 family malate/lactate/ureidoglycolate dehydrogenase
MMLLSADQLKSLYRSMIISLGGSEEEAQVFAALYVLADLRGMDWQGIKSIHRYVVYPIQQGITKLQQPMEVHNDSPASAVLIANRELGQVACRRAMELAIDKAVHSGCGAVVVRDSGDTGLLAGYTMMAPERDCIGVIFNDTYAFVAPWGGAERMHGIDPVSVTIPAGDEDPIVIDMALTPTQPAFDTPAIQSPPFPLPSLMFFESLREYAWTIIVELMSGGLAGMALGREKPERWNAGVFALAVHVPHFIDTASYRLAVDNYIRNIRASKTSEGEPPALLPGERGFATHKQRLRDGIPVPDEVWKHISGVAEELGVDWRAAMGF